MQNLPREAALGPGGTEQPPQQACQSQNEFSLDGRLRIGVGSDGHLESCIVVGVFQCIGHGFSGEPVTVGICPGPAFLPPLVTGQVLAARCGDWPRLTAAVICR